MKPFDYARAASVEEALSTLGQDGKVRLIAGGTDLLPLMKADIAAPVRLVDVKRVDGLARGASDRGSDGIEIGALTPLAQLERDELVRERYGALAQACGLAATPQIRNMATLGGNLLQRPRCWYYRNSLFECWLKGGDTCHARDGENQQHAIFDESPCVAVHPSDPAAALMALEASVHLRNPRGERVVPIAEFLVAPTDDRRRETTLRDDELLSAVTLPRPEDGTRSVYVKAMNRRVWAFALAAVAAAVRVDAGRITAARLVLGGVAPVPRRAVAAEQVLLGAEPNEPTFDRAAAAAIDGAQPLAHNGYKLALISGLLKQALREATRTD